MEILLRNVTTYLAFLSATVIMALTCDQDRYDDWKPRKFSEMFRNNGIEGLVKGRAVHIYPPEYISRFGGEVMTATVEVQCVYRGSHRLEQSAYINVTGFGDTNDCVNTLITVGNTYLLFLEPFSHGRYVHYAVQEFNLQRGVWAATIGKLQLVSSVYECRTVSLTTTTLAPWRSLTPIQQYPWIILPKGVESAKTTEPANKAIHPTPSIYHILIVGLVITVNAVISW